ncbi:MAG: ABC transporter substrate-binding protein [Armatimonadota bacterium]|nr:ABC transporter substrate-binding protein [Armatimonadota bacterium]
MRRVVCGALLLAALVARPLWPAEVRGQPRDVVRLAWWTDVGFPTPFAFSTLGPGGVIRLTLLYDTLVWKDARGLIPWLAESWQVAPDRRSYRFRLRDGVRWHDGRPLTARDVKFTFEYYRQHPFRWVDTSVVQAVDVRDRRTVVIRLRHPFAPFLENVAGIVPIVPAHIWQGVERPEQAQEVRMAVGSGPFRLVEYQPAAGLYRFAAVEDYWGGRPRVREVQYLLVPTERQVLAVQAGQVDVVMATTYDVVERFRGHPYLRVLETEPLSVARLIFHLDRMPTGAPAFRRAVAHALDRRRIAETITRGPAPVGNPGVVPPGDPWMNPHVPQYPYDPARVRALLAELGYTDRDGDGRMEDAGGAPLAVELVTSPVRDAELVRQMLGEVGIEVRVRTVDPATRAQLGAEGRFQLLFTTHIGSGGDPDYLRTWFTGEEANLFAAGSRMRSPEYLRLARRQLEAIDPTERRAVIWRMQAMLAEALPTLPLYYRRFFWIYDSRLLTPFVTRGGLLNGIPLLENKLIFLSR